MSNTEKIQKGTLLVLQGQEPKYIYYLTKGKMEILSAAEEFAGLDAKIIIEKSKRVGIIESDSLISGLSLLFTDPYKKSIRALEDSIISKFPIKEGGFKQVIADSPKMSISILSHLFKRLELSISDTTKYTRLYQNLCRINDNISLMFHELSNDQFPEKLLDKYEGNHNTFLDNGGHFPSKFDGKFLVTDNSSILNKKYTFSGLPLESLIDIKQCNFLKKFLKLGANFFTSVQKADPGIPLYMFETLSNALLKVLDRVEAIHNEIDEEIVTFFDDESSWTSYLTAGGYERWQENNRLSSDFLKNLVSLVVKVHSYYEEISGEKLSEIYPGFKKIHNFYLDRKNGTEVEPEKPATAANGNIAKYKNSLHQIFEFALIDKEFQKKFLKVMNTFKTMKNPFNTESDGRKIRRNITRQYWEIYRQAFIRAEKESVIPPPVRMLLRFGFLDDELMEDTQLSELDQLINRRDETSELPIYHEDEFLRRIVSGEIPPSISEMGQTYEQILREESGTNRKKSKDSRPEETDENIKKLMFDIDHRVLYTVAVCSGSTSTAFPILTKHTIHGSLLNLFISKKKIESTIKSLRDIDFSAFYRETVVKLGEKRELIEEEIIPNFVLIPAFGTKTMLWQDLVGINRRTRGRIVVPIFFMGDFLKSVAHTIACFRYELNRTMKGAMWRDPVDGGLTGIYLDYVQFFKKNPKLSMETKQKIAERFKSLRDDRNKFAEDYTLWVMYEKDGIPKLNTVVRDIFYKHIPFRKDIRSRLENMPAFSETANRFRNVHNRNTATYTRKFKKYMNENGTLPDELQKFMDFLNI